MRYETAGLRVINGGQQRLRELHDLVINLLDTKEKRGIRQLLQKNNNSCEKLIFPLIKEDPATVMTALSGILEAHARECYAIGFLDCSANRQVDNMKIHEKTRK